MTTQVLLDTNTYLRLAKRIRPAVGRKFGQVPYVLVVLKDVERARHGLARAHLVGHRNRWNVALPLRVNVEVPQDLVGIGLVPRSVGVSGAFAAHRGQCARLSYIVALALGRSGRRVDVRIVGADPVLVEAIGDRIHKRESGKRGAQTDSA